MTPHDLLAAFETLAEAPDGIARLRELVLQLAVRGKLVPQDPNDEPSCLLLERIATEKARLVKEGKIPKSKPLPPVSEDEVSFEIPEGWTWTRLGSLVSKLGAGSTPLGGAEVYVAVGAKFIRSQNVWNDGLRLDGIAFINEATHQRMAGTRVSAGDLLFNITGASIGRCTVVPDSFDTGNVSQHVAIVRPVYPTTRRYLHVALTSGLVQGMVTRTQVGISREGLSVGRLGQFPLPIPPLPEQHRIVAKVAALMAFLDRLEAARSERETIRAALRDAALAALRDAPDAEAVEVAWARIAERMDNLFTDPTDVAPLRQIILQLAVRGKLVPQDPNDEPACLFLEHIAIEKARLVKEGKISKPKPLPPVDEDEMPFKVPEGWAWCRLDALLVAGPTNGWSPKAVDFETPTRTLRLSATTRGTFDGSYFKHVDTVLAEDSPLWLRHSDLLIQRSNTPEYVGIAAVYDEEDGKFIYPDLMMRCRVTPTASVRFVHLSSISPIGRSWFQGKASGTSKSMVKVSQTVVSSTPIPLPPIVEQHRIVAKVDTLMALCDALEANLAATREAQAAFAAAAVHHLDV